MQNHIKKIKVKTNEDCNKPQYDKSPAPEVLDIITSEYNIERQKKASLETRAGISIAFIGTICVFLFDKINISNILALVSTTMSFLSFITIVSGLAVFVSLFSSLFYLMKTITISAYFNFETNGITKNLFKKSKIDVVVAMIFAYKDMISQHREVNRKKAENYKTSLYWLAVLFISTVIYLNIKECILL